MATARTRGPNYTLREQEILLDLIKDYPAVNCNKMDSKSHAQKLKDWETITKKFNSYPIECKRSTQNLRNLWKNMKASAKADFAACQRERWASGSGRSALHPHLPSRKVRASWTPSQVYTLQSKRNCDVVKSTSSDGLTTAQERQSCYFDDTMPKTESRNEPMEEYYTLTTVSDAPHSSTLVGKQDLNFSDSCYSSGSFPSSTVARTSPTPAKSQDTTVFGEGNEPILVSAREIKKRKAADCSDEIRANIFESPLNNLEEEQQARRKRVARNLEQQQLKVQLAKAKLQAKQQILNSKARMLKCNAELHDIKMKYYAAKLKSLE